MKKRGLLKGRGSSGKRWKGILSVALSLSLLSTGAAFAGEKGSAEETGQAGKVGEEVRFTVATDAQSGGRFVTRAIPYRADETLDYSKEQNLVLRYADTQEPIPMSNFTYESQWDDQGNFLWKKGYLFATVPVEAGQRKLEVYQASPAAFSDVSQEDYSAFVGGKLRARGVVSGNEKNQLLPDQEITRAEAVTMIVRVLGLEHSGIDPKGETAGYQDVKPGAWYYDDVMRAHHCGIVAEDRTFSPARPVSRQEFLAMAQRGFSAMGMVRELPDEVSDAALEELQDREEIAAYALPAYESLMAAHAAGLFDYVPSGETSDDGGSIDLTYARPRQAATREEAMEQLERMIRQLPVYPTALAAEWGFDEEMPVLDGSTSTYPFTKAVYGMLFQNGTNHPQCPPKHSKSHVSYQRLIDGEVDAIFASVYPASDVRQLAADKGVELELIPIAYDAMVFFTNSSNSAVGLTSQQISSIYVDDAYDNWKQLGGPDAGLIPYCRNDDSGSHAQMERHFLNGHPINQAIRVENTARSMSDVLTEVMDAGRDQPPAYALGYSIYYYYQNMTKVFWGTDALKLLAVDGVMPTDETIADGTYPLSNNTYLVLRKDEPKGSPARRLAEFMLTEEGQQCVSIAGFGPLTPVKYDGAY